MARITKAELETENTQLKEHVAKQKDIIERQQRWIYDVCAFIGKENKILTDVDNYLRYEETT
jgi:hypothetical protein